MRSLAFEDRLQILAEVRIVLVASKLFRSRTERGDEDRMIRVAGGLPVGLCVIRDHHA